MGNQLDKTRVAIVVDPEYGAELRALALLHPTWVVASLVNDETARVLWERGAVDLTTFQVTDPESRVENVLDILDMVYLHEPECDSLLLVGVTRSEAFDAHLAERSLIHPRSGISGVIVDILCKEQS